MSRWLRASVLLAALAAGSAACASDADESADGSDRPSDEVIDAVDTDGDGVVAREDVDDFLAETENEAERIEAEREAARIEAEREAERAAREAAVQAFLADDTAIAASFPGGELTVSTVLASIVEAPPSLMDDPTKPTRDQFVSRLTSMLQLRLVAVALTELGFPVDVAASDADINAMAQARIEGPFEAFAQERSLSEDLSIERLATPHCVSALVLESEADALAATDRVRGGESLADVALEVNPQGLTEPNGLIGCNLPLEMFGTGQLPLTLIGLTVGELSEPVALPSGVSPTGELWVVLRLDDLLTDQTDLASIGPFAPRVLSGLMTTYEIDVAPALGTWTQSSLSVALPQPGS